MKNTDKDEDIILKIPNSKKTSDNKEKTDNISLSCKKGTPIVIIGANGSGKTSFSMKIEELNDPYYKRHYEQNDATKKLLVQRISAQKSLVIPETISVQNTEAAFSELYYNGITHNRESKYQYNPHNIIISDYTAVLSLLFAKNNDELQSEHNQIKYNEKTVTPNNVCQTVTDKANEIWKKIFPNRDISFDKNNITMKFSDKKYKGKEMSDGERALLYMICQVLVLKKNSVLIRGFGHDCG